MCCGNACENKVEDKPKEHETPTTPGVIERIEEYFAANMVSSVFHISLTRAAALDANIIGVVEVAPSVTILS